MFISTYLIMQISKRQVFPLMSLLLNYSWGWISDGQGRGIEGEKAHASQNRYARCGCPMAGVPMSSQARERVRRRQGRDGREEESSCSLRESERTRETPSYHVFLRVQCVRSSKPQLGLWQRFEDTGNCSNGGDDHWHRIILYRIKSISNKAGVSI